MESKLVGDGSVYMLLLLLVVMVLFSEMGMILLLLFKTPFQKPLVVCLDRFKTRRAQLLVFVVATYSILISVKSPNYVILAFRMFEASLMGFSLFLLLTINTLHEFIREVVMLTDTIMVARKQNRAYEDIKKKTADEATFIRNKISKLKTEITKLESECNIKEQQVKSKKAHSIDVKISLEGFMEEYDRLLANNKDLRNQLQDINDKLSTSSSKKPAFFSWDQWGW